MAALFDQSGVDILLVGDSLSMVVLGLDSTVSVTNMAQMLHHSAAVKPRNFTAPEYTFGSVEDFTSLLDEEAELNNF